MVKKRKETKKIEEGKNGTKGGEKKRIELREERERIEITRVGTRGKSTATRTRRMRKTTTQHAQVTRPAARLVNYRLGVGVHEETTGKSSDVVADLIAFPFFHREGNPCFGSSRPTCSFLRCAPLHIDVVRISRHLQITSLGRRQAKRGLATSPAPLVAARASPLRTQ